MARAELVPTIGVFDSGVGGLSVLACIRARWANARYVYAADNAHFPYGIRSSEEVVKWTLTTVQMMNELKKLDLIVIACNTASTAALPTLREKLHIPVIGVVPAIKPAAAASKSGVIGLLATPGTVMRPYIDDLIAHHAKGVKVIRVGSSRLVDLAEAKLRGQKLDTAHVWQEIAPLFADSSPKDSDSARLDTIVLGCTHFPLLHEEFMATAPWSVQWIDSGSAVADRVAAVARDVGFSEAAAPADDTKDLCLFTERLGTELLLPMLRSYGLSEIIYPVSNLSVLGSEDSDVFP